MRITWGSGETRVGVNFYEKEGGKSQVTVQHSKLADRAAAQRMKTTWAATLERLKTKVESLGH